MWIIQLDSGLVMEYVCLTFIFRDFCKTIVNTFLFNYISEVMYYHKIGTVPPCSLYNIPIKVPKNVFLMEPHLYIFFFCGSHPWGHFLIHNH